MARPEAHREATRECHARGYDCDWYSRAPLSVMRTTRARCRRWSPDRNHSSERQRWSLVTSARRPVTANGRYATHDHGTGSGAGRHRRRQLATAVTALTRRRSTVAATGWWSGRTPTTPEASSAAATYASTATKARGTWSRLPARSPASTTARATTLRSSHKLGRSSPSRTAATRESAIAASRGRTITAFDGRVVSESHACRPP